MTLSGVEERGLFYPYHRGPPPAPREVVFRELTVAHLDSTVDLIDRWTAQLDGAGVLLPLSASKRNRSWEAVGLLA